jgi:glycerophosphoryl diester phosphodiesterase
MNRPIRRTLPRAALGLAAAVALGTAEARASTLVGRAVLPAETFAPGPTSGTRTGPANGVTPPYVDKQPVQGFSAVLAAGDGTYWVMSDNGFGSLENSADYHLRVYRIRPTFETAEGGSGTIEVVEFIELRDPEGKIPFAITNHFTEHRTLTGADFDIESFQRAPDGTLWFGDEFGPWLIHADATGKVLEAPIPLPDFDQPGRFLRARQNPLSEETSHLRVMNAVQAHARLNGNTRAPVFSPWHVMLDDGNAATRVDNRAAPPAGSGLEPASSELWNVASTRNAGFPVVVWTVNDKARMTELLRLGVNGIISDRPDLLLEAIREFDANGDGAPGDYLTPDGLVDITKIDAQGHRGARNLRPENTLPAMEAALDSLMTTLETDTGVTKDGVPVLDHDPYVESAKCRRLGAGPAYTAEKEVLVRDLPVEAIQASFVCDRLLADRPDQRHDVALSPVSMAFARASKLRHPYVMPTVQQLFDFVAFYARYYSNGAGRTHPEAAKRAKNASRVRFNIETKRNPRPEFVHRTVGSEAFVTALGGAIAANGLEGRADVQSFDFSTLLEVHRRFPAIRTVFLFGDFPLYADPAVAGSDDGTNLQPDLSGSTPWLAGLPWPYRSTALANPFRVPTSGGFEGMAVSVDGRTLLPLLEAPLAGSPTRDLLIHEFDLASQRYTGVRYAYPLALRGTNIGDYVMFSPSRGLVIERDGSQGRLDGFKAIYEVELRPSGNASTPGSVGKRLAVDLLEIADPALISLPGLPGDVGLGDPFAFPFVTIEDVLVLDAETIGVLNDNNFPGSVGRHLGDASAGQPRRPDDNEFVVIDLDVPLGTAAIP